MEAMVAHLFLVAGFDKGIVSGRGRFESQTLSDVSKVHVVLTGSIGKTQTPVTART